MGRNCTHTSTHHDKWECSYSYNECAYKMTNSSLVQMTAECVQSADNEHEKIKQKALIPLTILILFMNVVVLVFILANKRFHTPTYIFIASLSVSDLFVGFVSIITLTTKAHEKSQNVCLSRIGFTIVAISASVWSLTCVAVDRYIAVTRALRYNAIMTKRKTIFGIAWSWLVSMVIGFLPLMGWNDPDKPYQNYCSFMYVLPDNYILFLFLISAILPMTIMFVIYGILFKSAQFHIKQIQAVEKLQPDRRSSGVFGISARNLRSIKTFAAVLGCVVVTWLPLIIATTVEIVVTKKNCEVQEIIGTHLLVLGFSNSFLNPLIYALSTKDFRTKVGHGIRRRCYIADSRVLPSMIEMTIVQ